MIPIGVINRDHVLSALSQIEREGVPTINQSRGVEVRHDGKGYPPKYTVSLAFQIATGRVLPLSEFITTEAEHRLRGLGFSMTRTAEHEPSGIETEPLETGALAPFGTRRQDLIENSTRPMVKFESTSASASETVYLVSCVRTKRAHPATACELFISHWFVGIRELVERSGSPWFILSTRYGLVAPDEIISPYDYTLNTMGVHERRAWAIKVITQMQQRLPAAARIVLFAGRRYYEFLMDYLHGTGALVETPLERLNRGQRLGWLTDHRSGEPARQPPREKIPSGDSEAASQPILEREKKVLNPGVVAPLGGDWQLWSSLDNLEIGQEVRKLAEETISFFEQRPEASVRSGRAALIAIVRKLGARGTLDQAIRDLEGERKITEVTAIQMRTIQKIRNKVEYEAAKVTGDDARTCAVALVAILKAITHNNQ